MTDYCFDYNVADEFKPMKYEDVVKIQHKESIPIACAAINIAGSLNIGMMIRTAVIFGCRDFFIIGKKKYDKRSTVGADKYINIHKIDIDPFEKPFAIAGEIERKGYKPICIEQEGRDINFYPFYPHDEPKCLIFGSESEGIPDSLTRNFPVISVVQRGVIRSLNVSATCAIILHKAATDLKGYRFDYDTKRQTHQVVTV